MSRHASWNPTNLQDNIRALISGQCDILPITTPSTSLLEIKIPHGLGRVPKGFSVVKGDPAGGGTTAYTPAGSISQITPAGSVSQITPAGSISQITPAGSVTLTPLAVPTTIIDRMNMFGSISGAAMGSSWLSGIPYSYSPTIGLIAIRAGSITGISFSYAVTSSGSNTSQVVMHVYKNNANLCSVTGPTITSTADGKGNGTLTLGTYTFAAGDILGLYFDMSYTGTSATLNFISATAELAFDESATTGYAYSGAFTGTPVTPTFTGTPVTPTFTGTPVTPVFTGTPASLSIVTGAVAGDTAWDTEYIYLKFVAVSTDLTLAVW